MAPPLRGIARNGREETGRIFRWYELTSMIQQIAAATEYRDPLKRMTGTPLVGDLAIMGRSVRIETNSEAFIQGFASLFSCSKDVSSTPPDFVWRVVGEVGDGTVPGWPEMAAFSDQGLRYINLGRTSFLAVDLDSRLAIAFLPEAIALDTAGFASVFAATL